MNNSIIEVNHLYKKYKIGLKQPYYSFRDTMADFLKNPFSIIKKPLTRGDGLAADEFWALRDITFELKKGEILGIIGRNGAGKTTLLKLLSQITPPTKGEIILRGKVASLLEVGTGFHPELTGRENIYLNGAILGMNHGEIKEKFDEIVEFAETAKFLDTPVKYYSSGMYARLAFAIAVHLDPDILIVDEVLAVGDLKFQKKSIKKMNEASKQKGKTIIVVSHNIQLIQTLATHVLLLEEGKAEGMISTEAAIKKYLSSEQSGKFNYYKAPIPKELKKAYILEGRILNKDFKRMMRIPAFEPTYIEIKWVNVDGVSVNPNFMLINQNGVGVMISSDVTADWYGDKKKKKGIYVNRAKIPPHLLNTGEYNVHLALDSSNPKICYDNHLDALRFIVWDPIDKRSLARGPFTHTRNDVALWSALEWTWERITQ